MTSLLLHVNSYAPASRILIIRPSALGDVARTMPVLVQLRAAYPNAEIDWLVQDSFADVISAHPALTRVVGFPRRDFTFWRPKQTLTYLQSLRARRYDLVVDCQGLARSGLLARVTGAPTRVGHADARELGWLGYTRRVPAGNATHTVDRMCGLLASLGIPNDSRDMRLYTPAHAREFVIGHPKLAGTRYAVIAPTSRWVSKQWPDERFASVAQSLADDGLTIAIVGSANERQHIPACLALTQSHPRVIDLVGATSIAQLMDLIEHSALVIANDSAALHIAVGFDRPTVALFGPTQLDKVGPYRREQDAIQRISAGDRLDYKDDTTRSLMLRIPAEEVLEACRKRLT